MFFEYARPCGKIEEWESQFYEKILQESVPIDLIRYKNLLPQM
jgi:hypothetical protein